MSRDLNKADPILQEFVPKLQTWYAGKHTGLEIRVIWVDRSPAEQLLCFCQDRLPQQALTLLAAAGLVSRYGSGKVTDKDGYNLKSRHNDLPLSGAVDVAVFSIADGRTLWAESYYTDIGQAIFQLGYSGQIRWGGSWRDWGHLETRYI